ncbi:tRNA (adenosine(37)-N6)-threonylcarbamoyltransferase complex ATPase subunit type 1 TsaE [Patescibacteria group bacterium]|nr:tRNA (adenosine(37)-N6)-threonylcarbamoyltransferase complex ATPase subunit type 1 TsaE [Patescibacteria group bacterium]
MQNVVATIPDLEREAEAFMARLAPEANRATLITLSGELGAGKTSFTKALAKAYGVSESVTSPTFVLEKVYALPAATGFAHLIHIDAYRLKNGEELKVLGWVEIMKEKGNLILLEWPENVKDALPAPSVAIRLEPHADGSRTITYA